MEEKIKQFLDENLSSDPGFMTVEEVRKQYIETAPAMFGPTDPVEATEDRTIPGPAGPVPLRVYTPTDPATGTVVFFHGGAGIQGNLDTHDAVCRAISARTPCVVVAVDYRLAPEHRFPAGLEDAWAVTQWVHAHTEEVGGRPGLVAVAGDSFGAGFATIMALRARDQGLDLALQALIYPYIDLTDEQSWSGQSYWMSRDSLRWYVENYLGPDDSPNNPEVSPILAPDLSGVAPTLIIAAEEDAVFEVGKAYAERLRDAGVSVTRTVYGNVPHGFIRMGALTDKAHQGLDEIAGALATVFTERAERESA